MKKVILTISSSLMLALGFIAFQSGILLPSQQFFEINNQKWNNQISVAHAQSDQALHPQQAYTPLPGVDEQQIVSLVQTQAVQSNVQLSQAELQIIVQKVMEELQLGVYQAPIVNNPPQFIPTRTPRPIEVRQTQDAIVMTQTHQAALSQVQPASQDDFEGAYIYSYGSLIGKKYIITIQLKNEVKGSYYAKMSDKFIENRYKCTTTRTYPNRLYCYGYSIRGGQRSIYVYEEGTDKLVYVGDLILPRWTPTVVMPSPCPCCGECD